MSVPNMTSLYSHPRVTLGLVGRGCMPGIILGVVGLMMCFFALPATVSAATINRPIINSGLVGYWNFDIGKGGGTAFDMSGNRNNGTLTSMDPSSDWISGKMGQALDFDGSNDYVDVPETSSIDLSSVVTLSFWMKTGDSSSFGNYGLVTGKTGLGAGVANDHQYGIFKDQGTGKIIWALGNGSANTQLTSTVSVNTTNWVHVVGVYSAASTFSALYVNGVLNQSTASALASIAGSQSFKIGRGNGSSFFGSVDDVRVYNRVLSADEIVRLYKRGTQAHPTVGVSNNGLVGHWTLDDGAGTNATDSSGRGNTGSLQGGMGNSNWVVGKRGTALSFDGSNDYMIPASTTPAIGATQSLTYSMWIYPRSFTNGASTDGLGTYFLDRNTATNGLVSLKAVGNKYAYQSRSNAGTNLQVIQSTSDIALNTWTHIVLVREFGVGYRIYYNGNVQGSSSTGASDSLTPPLPTFGATVANNTFANVVLDDIRIYNRAISVDEIKTLYSASPYVVANAPTAGKYTTGLVGHWTFDGQDMSGVRALDASGQGNNGTLTGGPTRMAGKLGQGLQFDGSDDHINILSDFSEPSRLAVSLWFKTTDTDAALFGQHDAINPNTTPTAFVPTLGITTGGFLRGEFWTGATGGVTTSTQVNDGQWHHAVMVGDATSQFLYVDGVYIGSRSGTIAQSWWVRSVIGTGYDDAVSSRLGSGVASWKYFSGQIDEVRLYNRALSLNEVRLLYNLGR